MLQDLDLMVQRRVLQCYIKLINLSPAGSSEPAASGASGEGDARGGDARARGGGDAAAASCCLRLSRCLSRLRADER